MNSKSRETQSVRTGARMPPAPDWQNLALAVLDAVGSAVFVLDREGRVILSNPQAQTEFDLMPGVALDDRMPELLPYAARAVGDNRKGSDLALAHPSRSPNSIRVRITPLSIGKNDPGALGLIEDQTELENAMREMAAHQERSRELDTIIDSSNDGFWICDARGRVLRINAASERINSVKASDVEGRTMQALLAEGFVDRSGTLEAIESRSRVNLMQQTRSGRKLMVSANPVFDDDGSLIRVVITERDTTEIDTLRRELEKQAALQAEYRNRMLEMQEAASGEHRIVARSANMAEVVRQAIKLSRVDSSVLLLGESGTGKGIIADLIHRHSSRADKPMIHINCGAIPESLVESELFGYERGAFTGARPKGKIGYFEMADGGILFLDEIAELPLGSQVKLLRFLEDGRVSRVGGTTSRQVDVRMICATHGDLKAMVDRGTFREDLFYRLHVIPVRIPPVRERRECILPLIRHYLALFGKRVGSGRAPRISSDALNAMLVYSYPGNVRELMNLCERLVVMAEDGEIGLSDLPATVVSASPPADEPADAVIPPGMTLAQILEQVERRVLSRALAEVRTQTRMAARLGVNQSTIARKMKKYGLPYQSMQYCILGCAHPPMRLFILKFIFESG